MSKPINECPVPKGILVVIGGKENRGDEIGDGLQNKERLEILHTIVALTHKKDPVLEVVSTASGEAKQLFKEYVKAFSELGVKTINQIHHETRREVMESSEKTTERIKAADAVFFAGGYQLKLSPLDGGSDFLLQLKQRYIKEKLVVAGTSAGAMALSTPMIYAGNKEVQQISGEIKITTGLEFLKDVCIDTHFVDRSRLVRMAQVVATNPSCIGIGIEEDTALVVRNGLDAEICGNGIVIVIDGQDISGSNLLEQGTGTTVSIKGLKVNILSKGDRFTIPQTNPPHI